MTAPDSCPRCAGLEEQIAELTARTRFRPCGLPGPGSAMVELTMPGGRVQQGWLCRPHQVLLSAAGFALHLAIGFGGREGPCGWLVPAEEAFEAAEALPAEEVTA